MGSGADNIRRGKYRGTLGVVGVRAQVAARGLPINALSCFAQGPTPIHAPSGSWQSLAVPRLAGSRACRFRREPGSLPSSISAYAPPVPR
jgi:hypothetical protein